jgi:hypothetical protein
MKRYEKMTKEQLMFLIRNTPNTRLKLYLIKLLTLKATGVLK